MLTDLKKDYKIDPARVYATGHSNGGTFTYVLWETRSQEITAFAANSASLPDHAPTSQRASKFPSPKSRLRPVLHIAGKNDPLVKIDWQQNGIDQIRKLYHCTDGQPWGKNITLYPSPTAAPIYTWIHDGAHATPPHSAETIVKFFKAPHHSPTVTNNP